MAIESTATIVQAFEAQVLIKVGRAGFKGLYTPSREPICLPQAPCGTLKGVPHVYMTVDIVNTNHYHYCNYLHRFEPFMSGHCERTRHAIGSYSDEAQLLISSVRIWSNATRQKESIQHMLEPIFATYGANSALAYLDECMCLIAISAVRPIDVRCTRCEWVSDESIDEVEVEETTIG